MSALAMILAKSGYSISGSDNKKSSMLKELAANNINIFESQEPRNIDQIIKVKNKNTLVVISSAIHEDNLELNRARKKSYK